MGEKAGLPHETGSDGKMGLLTRKGGGCGLMIRPRDSRTERASECWAGNGIKLVERTGPTRRVNILVTHYQKTITELALL